MSDPSGHPAGLHAPDPPGRPRLVTYNVASLDGRLTTAPGVLLLAGDPRWTAITGATAADDAYARLRELHRPEVLLEGSGSFVPDSAGTLDLPEEGSDRDEPARDFLPADVVTPGMRYFAVVDGRGRVRWQFTRPPDEAWAGWHLLVLVCSDTPRRYLAFLRRKGIPYLVAGGPSVDLRLAVHLLGDRLGATCVVSTGGGRLNGALLRLGLVDEVDVEFVLAIVGGRGTPALFDAPPLGEHEQPAGLTLDSVERLADGHLLLRCSVSPPAGRP